MGFLSQILMAVSPTPGTQGGGGQVEQGDQPTPPVDQGDVPEGPPPEGAPGEGEIDFATAFDEALSDRRAEAQTTPDKQAVQNRLTLLRQCAETQGGILAGEADKGLEQSADQFDQVRQDQSQANSTFRMATETRGQVRSDRQSTWVATDRQSCLDSLTRIKEGGILAGQGDKQAQGGQQGQQGQQVRQPPPGANPLPGGQTQLGVAPQPQQPTAVPREPVPLQTQQQRHTASQTLRNAASRETDPDKRAQLETMANQLEGEGPVDEAAVQAALSEIETGEGEGTEETETAGTEGAGEGEGLGLDESQVVQETGSQGEGTGGDGAGTGAGDQGTAVSEPSPTLTAMVEEGHHEFGSSMRTEERTGMLARRACGRIFEGGVACMTARAVRMRYGGQGEEQGGHSGSGGSSHDAVGYTDFVAGGTDTQGWGEVQVTGQGTGVQGPSGKLNRDWRVMVFGRELGVPDQIMATVSRQAKLRTLFQAQAISPGSDETRMMRPNPSHYDAQWMA